MANHRRGEIDIDLAGTRYAMRLTLNALAEIEAAFAADTLAALGERLAGASLRAADLVALLGAALRGGGAALSDRTVGDLLEAGDLPYVAERLAALLRLNFGEGDAPDPRKAQRPVPPLRPSHGTPSSPSASPG